MNFKNMVFVVNSLNYVNWKKAFGKMYLDESARHQASSNIREISFGFGLKLRDEFNCFGKELDR